MSGRDALFDVAEELIRRAVAAGADQAEAAVAWTRQAETRIENGEVHTAQALEETSFGLRVFAGRRLGFATANTIRPGDLQACVEEAIAQARTTPSDPANGLPPSYAIRPVPGLFDPKLAGLDVSWTTRTARRLVDRVAARDPRVRVDSGEVTLETSSFALVSTEGTRAFEESTTARGYLFGMAVEGDQVASFDYDGSATHSLGQAESLFDAAADRFVEKCLAGLGARPGKSYRGAVVLSPEAVAEFLLEDLIAAASADNVRKGKSRLAGKIGKKIAARSFTVIDDPTQPGAVGSCAFDREGVPTRRYPIVEHGTLKGYLFNHYEAKVAGLPEGSTGHAVGSATSLPQIGPHRLEVLPGDTSLADLLEGGPVVYVGRFSGSTNPVTGEFSGVVKNGFLCENGRRQPVNETLVAGNLFDALARISGLSRERRLVGGTRLVPAVRLEDVSVTAG